jgi:hypothetical protein
MPNAYLLGVGNVLLVLFNFWDLPSSECEIFNPFFFPTFHQNKVTCIVCDEQGESILRVCVLISIAILSIVQIQEQLANAT